MKNSKKILAGLAAFVFVCGLVFSTSAFTKKDPVNLAYQYTGIDESGVMTPANWTPITYNPSPTACDAEGELVCVVQFNDTQFDNITDFLSNYSSADNVNESVYAKRHKEPLNR